MAYTAEQRQIINLSRRLSAGYGPRIRRSLLEAEAVESGFRNLNYGDRDSQGVLQQRPSQGWGTPGNAAQDIQQYLERAQALVRRGFHGSAGELAQAVQHSAFPGRYDQHASEASSLLGGSQGGGSPLQGASGPNIGDIRARNPRQVAQALLDPRVAHDPLKLLAALRGAQAQPAPSIAPRGGASAHPDINMEIQGPVDRRARAAIQLARSQVGKPYVWGAEGPGSFDCSGLLQYVMAKEGVQIPRTTYDQWGTGKAIGKGALRPGDAVFFRGSDPRGNLPGHVGIYIGGGRFIEAPGRGKTVRISTLKGRTDFAGARRYV